MEQLVTRAYNRFEIDDTKGIIRKLSSTERLRDEIWYYNNLNAEHPDQAVLFPRIIDGTSHMQSGDASLRDRGRRNQQGQYEYWMDLELYDYPNAGSYLFGDNIMPSWADFFISLRNILSEWTIIHPRAQWTPEEIQQAATDMYITKTDREFHNFRDGWHDKFDNLFIDQVRTHTIMINRKQYSMFEVVWPQIKHYIKDNMLNFTPSLIHGDCCFSNILYGDDKNIIRFIDPRGSFGNTGIYGDIRYDIAKLYHSVDGTYEAFITDKFKVHANGNTYEIDIKNTGELAWAQKEFEHIFFPHFNKKEIKILQGCIFIGMCARHYDSMERQRAMYLTGTRLLNEALAL
jgi:hypothetical protein